jgi:hypothetical protein
LEHLHLPWRIRSRGWKGERRQVLARTIVGAVVEMESIVGAGVVIYATGRVQECHQAFAHLQKVTMDASRTFEWGIERH